MPVFEYKCSDCNTKFEVFHKSQNENDEIHCPNCSGQNYKKLFSSFSASFSESGSPQVNSCADGSCAVPSNSACSSGLCSLN